MEATKRYKAEGTETGKAFWIVDALSNTTIGLLDKTTRESINLIVDALNQQPTLEQAKAALKAMIATWDSYLSNPLGYPAYQQAKKVLAAMETPQ